jgi:fucose 4-O-acetylase-like acetyltransferase
MIDFNFELVKKYTILTLFLPYIFFQTVYVIYYDFYFV